jgi:Flp pilus assembly protein TadG
MLGGRLSRRRGQQGTAVLEFALVAPLILYLVLGLITYGWILAFRQTMSQATAEGARAAAVSPAGNTATQLQTAAMAAVNDSMSTYDVTCDSSGALVKSGTAVGTCTITIAPCVNDTSTRCVSVALDYLYRQHPLIPLPGMGIATPNDVTYTAVAQVSS